MDYADVDNFMYDFLNLLTYYRSVDIFFLIFPAVAFSHRFSKDGKF